MPKRDLERCREKYEKEAILVGLKYIGGSDKGLEYRRYVREKCNHILDILPANVRKDNFLCGQCLQLKYETEAKDCGIVFMNKVSRGINNYKLDCGHTQNIHISAVRNNEWLCRKCNKTYFELPSSLYLLQMKSQDFSWLKLGYTNNLKVRVRSYKLINTEWNLLNIVPVPTGSQAIKIEQSLHSKYFKDRLNPNVMKNYHSQDGYTECYPTHLLDKFLEELKIVEQSLL